MRTLFAVLLLSACAFAQGLGGKAGMGGKAGIGGGASGGGGGAAPVLDKSGYCPSATCADSGTQQTIAWTGGGTGTSGDIIHVLIYVNNTTHTFTLTCDANCSGFSQVATTSSTNGGQWNSYLSATTGVVTSVKVTPSGFTNFRVWTYAVAGPTALDSGVGSGAGFVTGGSGFSGGTTLSIGPSGTLAASNEIGFCAVANSGGSALLTISDSNGTDVANPASPDLTSSDGTVVYSRIPGVTTTQTCSVPWTSSGTTVDWFMVWLK